MRFLHFAYGEGYGRLLTWILLYLNMTLFLAYASMFPEMEVYLYDHFNQGKMAWILRWIIFNLHFLSSGFTVAGISVKVSIVAALLNFLLFFSMKKIRRIRSKLQRLKQYIRRRRGVQAELDHAKEKNGAMHECAVCLEQNDDPELEFRLLFKCDGIMNIVKIIYLPISM